MKGLRNLVPIQADAEGNAPSVIELLRTGNWHTPWHGDFSFTTEDFQQFVTNFSDGIGLVEGDKQAPVNFGHFMSGEAAGWIKSLVVSEDGQALLGNVEWTDEARDAIRAKKWKYISPEFNPRSWPWEDPEEENRFVNNVLTGAGLTNIPLFKKLKPITASRLADKGVKASEEKPNEEGESMNIADILAKAVQDRTDEEKAYLNDHKAELTEDQTKQLETEAGAEVPAQGQTPAEKTGDGSITNDVQKDENDPEGGKSAPITASALRGMTDAELTKLAADARAGREASDKLARNEATAFVETHIAAGRIKTDQKDATVNMILASTGEARTNLETFIGNLPASPLTASEQGNGGEGESEVTVNEHEKTLAEDFGNTEEEIAEYKKKEAAKAESK